jgi:uncharacterized membrane protein YkvA (DUF1232 family)
VGQEFPPGAEFPGCSLHPAVPISPAKSAVETHEQILAVNLGGGMPDVNPEGLIDRLQRNLVVLIRDIIFLYRLLRHPETPWYARGLLFFPVMYLCSPIQAIPNFIPVIGQLDDVFLIWITKRFVPMLIDEKTRQECQDAADAADFSFFETFRKRQATTTN